MLEIRRSVGAAYLVVFLLAWGILRCSATASEDDFRIEGDPELIQLLMAAQTSNRAAFPEGELTAKVTLTGTGRKLDLEAHMAWQGESSWWDYHLAEQGQDGVPTLEAGSIIETPQTLVTFFPGSNLVQIYAAKRRSYNRYLNLRPDRRWFATGDDIRFDELLDVLDENAQGRNGQVAVRVWKEANDTVVVERIPKVGGIFRMTASLAMDGNIVSYASEPSAKWTIAGNGRLDWVRAPSGRWRLERYEHDLEYLVRRKGKFHCELEVTEFSEDLEGGAGRFEIGALNIAQGVKVQEFTPTGTVEYSWGSSADEFLVALERQVRELREKGFAAPPIE